MAIHHIETRLLQLEISISIGKDKVAAFHFALIVEHHSAGL